MVIVKYIGNMPCSHLRLGLSVYLGKHVKMCLVVIYDCVFSLSLGKHIKAWYEYHSVK